DLQPERPCQEHDRMRADELVAELRGGLERVPGVPVRPAGELEQAAGVLDEDACGHVRVRRERAPGAVEPLLRLVKPSLNGGYCGEVRVGDCDDRLLAPTVGERQSDRLLRSLYPVRG